MKKTMKRTLAIVMVVAMLFALSSFASAAQWTDEPGSNTVTVVIKTVDSNYQTTVLGTEYVIVSTGDTIKDVVNEVADQIYSCNACNQAYGCTSACSCSNCVCTWKMVQKMDSNYNYINEYASALNSLEYNEITYTNWGGSVPNGTGGYTYTGQAWEYYIDNVYQLDYMSDVSATAGTTITIVYNYSSFDWSY